jgi:alpha-tubulin suppressor-like RCC1 family protein
MATGDQHVCGLMSNGEISCWGNNAFGTLAQQPSFIFVPNPIKISGILAVVSLP